MHMRKDSILLLAVVWLLGVVALSACGSEQQSTSAASNVQTPPTATAIPEELKLIPEPTQPSAADLAEATTLGFNIRGWT